MTIRNEQIQVFEDNLLHAWALRRLRQLNPDCSLLRRSPNGEDFVSRTLLAGRALGIESSQSLLRYTNVCLSLGENFASSPALTWVREILEDSESLWMERLERLEARITQDRESGGSRSGE